MVGTWRWLHGELLLKGTDLCDLVELPASAFFDIIDSLYVHDNLTDAYYDGGLTKTRVALDKVYDRRSYSLSDTYGGSNDDAGHEMVNEHSFLPPGAREVRPYLPPTEQTESGFTGLEAPLG